MEGRGERQAYLRALLERFGCPAISLSEPFEDGPALLRVVEQRGLEGVVSKRRDAPYRSGECRDWRKVNTGERPIVSGGDCSSALIERSPIERNGAPLSCGLPV